MYLGYFADMEVEEVEAAGPFAKNCDLLIEIGGRMDGVCESCRKVFRYPINTAVRN